MNKQYIKRQITLHEFGIHMDRNIQRFYDYFIQLIGDINELEVLTHDLFPNSIFYRKEGKILLEHDRENDIFLLDYDEIWAKFIEKFRLNYEEYVELFGALCDYFFNIETITTKSQLFGDFLFIGGNFKNNE